MKKKQLPGSLSIALGATFAVSIAGAGIANAEENPFALSSFEKSYQVAVDTSGAVDAAVDAAKEAVADAMEDAPGRDMAGNMVNYNYGGDSKGTYAGGKVGTGVKDPSVCGTFTGAVCGADGGGHLKK